MKKTFRKNQPLRRKRKTRCRRRRRPRRGGTEVLVQSGNQLSVNEILNIANSVLKQLISKMSADPKYLDTFDTFTSTQFDEFVTEAMTLGIEPTGENQGELLKKYIQQTVEQKTKFKQKIDEILKVFIQFNSNTNTNTNSFTNLFTRFNKFTQFYDLWNYIVTTLKPKQVRTDGYYIRQTKHRGRPGVYTETFTTQSVPFDEKINNMNHMLLDIRKPIKDSPLYEDSLVTETRVHRQKKKIPSPVTKDVNTNDVNTKDVNTNDVVPPAA